MLSLHESFARPGYDRDRPKTQTAPKRQGGSPRKPKELGGATPYSQAPQDQRVSIETDDKPAAVKIREGISPKTAPTRDAEAPATKNSWCGRSKHELKENDRE